MRRAAFVLVLGVSLLGCSRDRDRTKATAAGSAPRASATASATPSAVPALDEPGVKALVGAWLAAQNAGDFAAYERLYAPRFTGVKRAGERETTFDREGWLTDRKSMVARPMSVEAARVDLRVTPRGASAELEQTWSSATYRDVGVKRFVIVPTPEGPRIAREEMVSSRVAGAEARPGPGDVLVVHRDGLILDARADEGWASGPSRLAEAGHVVYRDVHESKLPAGVKAWKGRAVRAFSADGSACTTQVNGFSLRAEVVPHFGMVQQWRGEPGRPPASADAIAQEVWELAGSEGKVLVGKLNPTCSGSVFALGTDKTLPLVATKTAPTPELREAATSAFRALPSYQRIQTQFVSYGKNGPWELSESDALQLSLFSAANEPVLVVVAARAGAGCGNFYGALTAVFAPRPGTKPALELIDEPDVFEPIAAFALGGSGSFQILFSPEPATDERSLWRRDEKGASLRELFAIPFLDCPC